MSKFLVGPNRNASFPDTPFLYNHTWSHVGLSIPRLPLQFTIPRVREMLYNVLDHSRSVSNSQL